MKVKIVTAAMVSIASVCSAAEFRADVHIRSIVGSPGFPSPQSEAFGSFNFIADSLASPIQSLSNFSLSFGGYSYSNADVSFQNNPDGSAYVFGGSTLVPMNSLTNDFYFYLPPSRVFSFSLTTLASAGHQGFFDGQAWFTFTDVTSPVPEPSAWAMLGAGVLLVLRSASKRKRSLAA